MSLRRQTLWSMMPILVTSVVSVLTVPLYFKLLGEQMYALWFYVATLSGAFGFMDLGLGVAVGRFIGVAMGRKDDAAIKEYWATGNAIVLPFLFLFALIFVLLGTILGPVWFKVETENAQVLRWAVVWSGFGLFFSYYGQMWNILAQAYLDFKYLSVLRTCMALASTLGAVVIVWLTRNVACIMAYTAVLALGQFSILLFRGHHHYRLPLRLSDFRYARLVEMLPYTLKTFGQLLSGSVLGSLDRLFLGRIAPAVDFAAYNVSMNIGGRISGLSVAIMGPIFHNTTRGVGGDESRKPADVYRESFNLMFPWYSLVIVGVFFWSGPVTELWLGPKYGSSVGQAFPWVVSALCLNAMANISGAQLGGLNRVGMGLILQTASALVGGLGVLVGWYAAGLEGSSIGYFISRLVWIIQDAMVRKWVGIPKSEYGLILRIIGRQCVLVGGMWVMASLIFTTAFSLTMTAILSGVLAALFEVWLMKNRGLYPGRSSI